MRTALAFLNASHDCRSTIRRAQSTRDQRVRIAAAYLDLHFTTGKTIHTENSYKFTHETIRTLLDEAGFEVEHIWTDARGWYSVTLARNS